MTLWDNIPRGSVYLKGPSANPTWDVPLALHSLLGVLVAAEALVRLWEHDSGPRLSGEPESNCELGSVAACIVVTSYAAETALKTIVAQTKPNDEVPRTHDLSELFHKHIPRQEQESIQHRLEALPNPWRDVVGSSTASNLLDIARTNFVDWRYVMEPKRAQDGIPKPLLAVAIAVTLVGTDLLGSWQTTNRISPP